MIKKYYASGAGQLTTEIKETYFSEIPKKGRRID